MKLSHNHHVTTTAHAQLREHLMQAHAIAQTLGHDFGSTIEYMLDEAAAPVYHRARPEAEAQVMRLIYQLQAA